MRESEIPKEMASRFEKKCKLLLGGFTKVNDYDLMCHLPNDNEVHIRNEDRGRIRLYIDSRSVGGYIDGPANKFVVEPDEAYLAMNFGESMNERLDCHGGSAPSGRCYITGTAVVG